MRYIERGGFWIGHVGDARDVRTSLDAGISALVDLASNELPHNAPRDIIYCRFPLIDGADSATGGISLAVQTLAGLLRMATTPMIFCSNGLSRSPAISAGAMAIVTGRTPETCLEEIARAGPLDVSPRLWSAVVAMLQSIDKG